MSEDVQARDEALRIAAVPYVPPGGVARNKAVRVNPLWLAFGGLGVLALAAVLFLVLARAVQIDIAPATEHLDVDGGFGFALGSNYLLFPGDYRVQARVDGYEDLAADFVVTDAAQQTFRFEMKRLPGKLALVSDPSADVFIDGNPRGSTPLEALELAPGSHRLMLRAPRYQVHEAEVNIEGGGIVQNLRVNLVPGWAPVSIRSVPAGAEILIDGVASGSTPKTLEVGSGAHEIGLRLEGHAQWKDRIAVTANEPLDLPEVKLLPADGALKIASQPAGASVSVNGAFRGQTPLQVNLPPGRAHRIQFSAPGYRPAERSVEMAAESSQDLSVALEPILGTVLLDVQPAEAKVKVDGRDIAPGTTRLELTATAHRIEASQAGYGPYTGSVTPRQGFEQRVEIRLKSEAEARAARMPARVTSKAGPRLVLIQPGTFTTGTKRGEQGRQANEAQRPVKLTRAFYLGTTEVTNAQFRKFAPPHSSGIVRRFSLDNENQPVARIGWAAAVRYCNWLSAQDGLPLAYGEDGSLVQPVNTGYRLPSEAEWDWAARFAGQSAAQRYSWGSGFPPPPKSGNFADQQAEGTAPEVLPDYDDGFPAAGAVASFAPNALGLYDLGGNVAEWVHDAYDPVVPINPPEALDPFGPATGSDRVIRGSSWLHGRLIELRLAFRDAGQEPRPDLGFRVARYAE
ncbi:MAG: PEGA domain-containing protein [Panacagrimonas sp.]